MGNAVDSLINFNALVFEEKREKAYGHDKEEYIALADRLMGVVSEVVCSYRNLFGGKVKFGLSSPNYIRQGFQTGYTFDGRRVNELHISARDNAAYTEIVSFASQLHYTGRRIVRLSYYGLYRLPGGVAFSGGEALLQANELEPLLRRLQKEHIHIAVETCLFVNPKLLKSVLVYIDLSLWM